MHLLLNSHFDRAFGYCSIHEALHFFGLVPQLNAAFRVQWCAEVWPFVLRRITPLGPIGFRLDVGDEIYFNDSAHHNLRVTFGPTIRF